MKDRVALKLIKTVIASLWFSLLRLRFVLSIPTQPSRNDKQILID